MPSIVYLANPFLKPLIPLLDKAWTVHCSWENSAKENAVCLATSVWDKVDHHVLNQFPQLKMISHLGLGLDNFDLAAIENKSIHLASQPEAGVHDTAELAIALMLGLSRKLHLNDRYIRENHWPLQRPRHRGNNIRNKKLGLLGLGQIGRTIAGFAEALGMTIYYTATAAKDSAYHYVQDITSLAQQCDYLVVCCSGGERTRHLVDSAVLSALGPDGYLINVSRGSVIDENALVQALGEQRIAGAALDVFQNEPFVPDRLKQMDNVLLSPHMGSSTHENLEEMFTLQAYQLNSYLQQVLLS